jgi:hypothetical protein
MGYVDPLDEWMKKKQGTAGTKSVSQLASDYAETSQPWATSSYAGSNAPPVGRIGLTPGWTPNYEQLILGDPSYLAWKNNSQRDIAQSASARKAALQALAIRHGGMPAGTRDTYGDIDQATLDLAQKNEFSNVNRLQRSLTRASRIGSVRSPRAVHCLRVSLVGSSIRWRWLAARMSTT